MAINNSMPKINDYLQGFQDGLPGMKDFRHASRLFIDDNYKLAPKQKFLFHTVFYLNDDIAFDKFTNNERIELNMLVKSCELPRFNLNLEEKTQYNKKMYVGTRIQYDALNIVFHDDHADTVNAFWKKYYEYHVADSVSMVSLEQTQKFKDSAYDYINSPKRETTKFGLDTPNKRGHPFLRAIEIFVLHKQRFTSMTLINPVIGSFNHDNVDMADGAGIMQNTMQVLYETVTYKAGAIKKGVTPQGFATVHYDHEPSPLTILGGGTNSIFGPGGIVDGVGSVMRMLGGKNPNYLGAILAASNTYNNAKKIKKSAVKEELKGIIKGGVLDVGKQAGAITNPVSRFTVGAAAAVVGMTLATPRGTSDNKTGQINTVISNPNVDYVNFLTADETYKLVTTNNAIKDEIAAGVYYKDIGSRKGLTVAESDVEYTGSSDNVKTVYRAKAITNIRKLVTEGYIKVDRQTQDVSITAEKAGL